MATTKRKDQPDQRGGHTPKGPPADIEKMLKKLPKGPAPGAVQKTPQPAPTKP